MEFEEVVDKKPRIVADERRRRRAQGAGVEAGDAPRQPPLPDGLRRPRDLHQGLHRIDGRDQDAPARGAQGADERLRRDGPSHQQRQSPRVRRRVPEARKGTLQQRRPEAPVEPPDAPLTIELRERLRKRQPRRHLHVHRRPQPHQTQHLRHHRDQTRHAAPQRLPRHLAQGHPLLSFVGTQPPSSYCCHRCDRSLKSFFLLRVCQNVCAMGSSGAQEEKDEGRRNFWSLRHGSKKQQARRRSFLSPRKDRNKQTNRDLPPERRPTRHPSPRIQVSFLNITKRARSMLGFFFLPSP
mmetsp:Transcript_1018/g.3467  ORF Transcript_1018/g.3467 Transcript_1018/m.3467 type:complete len:296 (-) Transcript_1018:56-943(-)